MTTPSETPSRRLRTHDTPRGPVAANLAAVAVNYDGWRDTAACVVSLLEGSVAPRWIVVVDNASTDDSVARLRDFLAGRATVDCEPLPFSGARRIALRRPAGEVSVESASADGGAATTLQGEPASAAVRVVMLAAAANAGFAAGNNIAIRWLAAHGFEGFHWLINSDAYAAPDCVRVLADAPRLPPLLGTVLVDYDRTDRVQTAGGRLIGPHAQTRDLDAGRPLAELQAEGPVRRADYPVGASMLFHRAAGEPPVLLDEAYFLYYEEADLARRLGVRPVAVHTRAVVAHRGGASTGGTARHSALRDYYSIRARILFARHGGIVPALAAALFGGLIAAKRFASGAPGAGPNALAAIRDGLLRRGGRRGSAAA